MKNFDMNSFVVGGISKYALHRRVD